eukprot:scaffold13_cov377-Prasinococcus_capsulatus_cf.AAC.10
MEEAKHALESLSVKLAGRKTSGPFFFGKTPSSIDATLLGKISCGSTLSPCVLVFVDCASGGHAPSLC